MYIQAGFLSVSWSWDSSYGHVTAMLAVTPWDWWWSDVSFCTLFKLRPLIGPAISSCNVSLINFTPITPHLSAPESSNKSIHCGISHPFHIPVRRSRPCFRTQESYLITVLSARSRLFPGMSITSFVHYECSMCKWIIVWKKKSHPAVKISVHQIWDSINSL